jgi:hypothetical protein
MTCKTDWHPFKGLLLDILFCGTGKWTRGQVVQWGKYSFQFVKNGRVRAMSYMRYEIEGIKIVWRPNHT